MTEEACMCVSTVLYKSGVSVSNLYLYTGFRHGLTLVAFPDPSTEALGMVPSLIHVISRPPLQSYSHVYSQTPSAKGTLP